MTRNEYVKLCESGKRTKLKSSVIDDNSVTDPTFAQSGRAMIFNPLPIDYRVQYQPGVPLNKENPHEFAEFDKMYPDKFKAHREALEQISRTGKQLMKIKELQEQPQQPQEPQQ